MHELRAAQELDRLLDGSAAALLDALMTHVPLGITIARAPDVEILRVSDAGSALLQRPRSSLEKIAVEMHSDAYQVSDPVTLAIADPASLPLTRATQQGEVVQGEEWLITAEDGKRLSILCNAGPIRNGQGEIIGGIIAWADITRQKQLEADLRDALEARDTLLAELQHRVKNHLAIVSSVLRAEARGGGSEAQALADRLQQRLNALASSYGALQFQEGEPVAAEAFLRHVCEPLVSKSVAINVEADTSIKISSEAGPILGIIVNEAVCNAIKHAFSGDQTGQIDVSLQVQEGAYLLKVRDDGRGIGSVASKGKGSGLMARLAKQLRGTVELRSEEGCGAVFAATFHKL